MKIKKQINTAKLKVKYVLGSYSSLSSYPDAEDVIFEFIRDYCGKVAKDIKFTNVSLQKKYDLTEEKTRDSQEKLPRTVGARRAVPIWACRPSYVPCPHSCRVIFCYLCQI